MNWIETSFRLPAKHGISSCETVDCLVFVNGEVERCVWDCENLVWNDAQSGEFKYNPNTPTHWVRITPPILGIQETCK